MGSERRVDDRERSRDGGRGGTRRPAGLQQGWQALHGSAGNRALGRMLSRTPTTDKAKPGAGADQAARDELRLAEEWVIYLARRATTTKPTTTPPARHTAGLQALLDAIWGAEGKKDEDSIAQARAFLKALKADHDRLDKETETYAFTLADVALERVEANRQGSSGFDRQGATQVDYAQTMAMIWTEADDELKADKAAGYIIPARLETLGKEAQDRFNQARKGWDHEAASDDKVLTPVDEKALVGFRSDALKLIAQMRSKRVADESHARQREAEALREAADRQLAEVRVLLADRRHALYMAGEKGKLNELHEATGDITRAIDDVKHAASIITDRVDTINKIAKTLDGGKALINLPSLPKGVTDAVKLVQTAHAKIGKALELLDLLGASKTSFDEGLKYLKGVEMAVEEFTDKDPVLSIYVKSYLGPALKTCIAQLGQLAGMVRSQNRSAINAGMPDAVNWNVEPGGVAMYAWMVGIFKQGATAPISDPVLSYLDDQDDDISAAVDDRIPSGRNAINEWGVRNRYAIWESLYGSARPPR